MEKVWMTSRACLLSAARKPGLSNRRSGQPGRLPAARLERRPRHPSSLAARQPPYQARIRRWKVPWFARRAGRATITEEGDRNERRGWVTQMTWLWLVPVTVAVVVAG